MNRAGLIRGGLVAALSIAAMSVLASGAAAQNVQEAQSVCTSCHKESQIAPMTALGHSQSTTCLSCHHVGFSNDPEVIEERRIEACESCHGPGPETHASLDPACTSCHTMHGEPDVVGPMMVEPGSCETCHGSEHTLHSEVAESPDCGSCHTVHDATETVLSAGYMNARCETCHETEAVHPSHAGIEGGLPCLSCHEMDARGGVGAAPSPAALSEACASCHDEVMPAHETVSENAPSCVECHAFGEPSETGLAGPAVSRRCGACHTDEMAALESGGHAAGVAASDPNTDLPNCMTCHTAHADPSTREANTRLSATIRCIECHSNDELIDTYDLPEYAATSYLDDYHGATVKFLWNHPSGADQPNVMVCSDCHGAHAVGWDPATSMAPVCLECHEEGSDKLAGAWVGHQQAGPDNQILVWLIRLFYWVLIPFVLGGLIFNIVLHLRRERHHGARMATAPKVARLRKRLAGEEPEKPATVKRFSLQERIEHMLAGTTFLMLVVTGLPQTAPNSGLANGIISFFGGIASTRLIHRIVGFTFVALLVIHVVKGVLSILRSRQLPAIMPTRYDFRALLQTVRHYVLGEPKPKIGKFDAAAKFEYWGLFFGGLIMSVTGIVLVFPELVSTVLPGEVVSAMRTMHGLEATFAVSVVLLWHSWSVIFRPDIFPLDTSMFTGEIEVERLKEEHALEYERLAAEGELATETD